MRATRKQTEKRFDTLAFKAKTQAEIAREISGMSPAEEIEYFRKSTERGSLASWWEQVKAEQARTVRHSTLKRRKKNKDAA